MLNTKNLLNITKKEIRSFFDNPSAYIVLIIFVLLWQFIFFRNVFLIGEVSLRSLYDTFPWLMLILVPAVTMGSIAKEKDEGTLEWVLTHPIRDLELILAKFLGAFVFVFFALLFSFPIAVTFSKYGSFDWGTYVTQLLGSMFFAASLISLGVFVSSLLKNQIAVLLLTAGLGFLFIIVGSEFFAITLPLSLAPILERLSLVSHLSSMAKGVIDLRDVWYFISFILVFLSLGYLQLLFNKFGNKKSVYSKFQMGVLLFIGIAIFSNVAGNKIQGRLDLTKEKLYTLSASTKKTLNEVDDIITITLYASSQLPAQYQPILRDIKDMLNDYKNSSNGAVNIKIVDPAEDDVAMDEVNSLGIRQIQFNVVGKEEFQVKQGYLGLKVSYVNDNEIIPFVLQTNDLEYQLTSIIKKLTVKDKKHIAFLTGHEEKDVFTDYSILNSELSSQYEVSTHTITEENPVVGDVVDVLMIAGPHTLIEDYEKEAIRGFLNDNKSLFVLIDTYDIDQQNLVASEILPTFSTFVSEYGVTINSDLAYDLKSNETIRFSNGVMTYFLPYPYWIRAQVKDQTPVTSKVNNILLPWTSSLEINENILQSKGYELNKLLVTTNSGGVTTQNFVLRPDQDFVQNDLGEKVLAASLVSSDGKGRIVVVGDSDFLTDTPIQNSPQNLGFALNALSWLSNSDSLADIRVKNIVDNKFKFDDSSEPVFIKYFNLGLAFGLPIIIGVVRLTKRRKLRNNKYEI